MIKRRLATRIAKLESKTKGHGTMEFEFDGIKRKDPCRPMNLVFRGIAPKDPRGSSFVKDVVKDADEEKARDDSTKREVNPEG